MRRCGHEFHSACLHRAALHGHSQCPLCRSQLTRELLVPPQQHWVDQARPPSSSRVSHTQESALHKASPAQHCRLGGRAAGAAERHPPSEEITLLWASSCVEPCPSHPVHLARSLTGSWSSTWAHSSSATERSAAYSCSTRRRALWIEDYRLVIEVEHARSLLAWRRTVATCTRPTFLGRRGYLQSGNETRERPWRARVRFQHFVRGRALSACSRGGRSGRPVRAPREPVKS